MITDITELKKLNEELCRIAYRDNITGLMNRVVFDEVAVKYVKDFHANNQKFALLYLDMDGLKFVNDSYGYPVGDKLIQETGKRITSVLKQNGEIARIGGDEFILLIPFKDRQEVVFIIEKILAFLKKPMELEKRNILLSASIGIACYPVDGCTLDALVQHAR